MEVYHVVVGFHLNCQLYRSQTPYMGSIEGMEDGSFLVDVFKNAYYFSSILEWDIYSLFIVHQDPANHGIKDFHLT